MKLLFDLRGYGTCNLAIASETLSDSCLYITPIQGSLCNQESIEYNFFLPSGEVFGENVYIYI